MEYLRNIYPCSGAINYCIFAQQTQRLNANDPTKSQWENIKALSHEVKGSTLPDLCVSFTSNAFYSFIFRNYAKVLYSLGVLSPPSQVALLETKVNQLKKAIDEFDERIESLHLIIQSDDQYLSQDELAGEKSQLSHKYQVKIKETEKLVSNLRDELRITNDKLNKEVKRDQILAKKNNNAEKVFQFLLSMATKLTTDLIFFPINKISIWYLASARATNPTWLRTATRFTSEHGIKYYNGYLPQFILSTLYSLIGPPILRNMRSIVNVPIETDIMKEIYPHIPNLLEGVPDDDEIFSVLDKNKPILVRFFRYMSKKAFTVVIFDWMFQMGFYPLILLRNSMMVDGSSDQIPHSFADTMDAVQQIYNRDGFYGFYSGIRLYSFTVRFFKILFSF